MYREIGIGLLLLMSSLGEVHANRPLPQDVALFIARRDLCDHFRGEDAYDAERKEFLAKRMHEYCDGTDGRLAALKKKYRAKREVMARLSGYETKIEVR
jgi:hypothetical protein